MGKYVKRKRTRRKWILWVILALVCVGAVFVTKFLWGLFHKPKVSVIIPVYKVENCLDECLESVENQTFKDIEIICVNDGSPDRCPEILQNHAKKDKRITIINQENQGLSMARNAGLSVAKGEYIYFLDSDDIIVPYAMEKAVTAIEKYSADMLEFKYEAFKDGETVDYKNHEYKNLGEEVIELKDGQNPFKTFETEPVVWNKVFRHKFLTDHDIKFKKGIINEDVPFNWKVKLYLTKVVEDHNSYHFYRTCRSGSIMNSDFNKIKKRLDSALIIIEEFANSRDELNFEDKDNYIFESMLQPVYVPITQMLKGNENQGEYAKKAVYALEDNFVKKYRVELSDSNKKQLNDLKILAKK